MKHMLLKLKKQMHEHNRNFNTNNTKNIKIILDKIANNLISFPVHMDNRLRRQLPKNIFK
jgi:hypothetical protein